jgi:hypothetical protein
MRLKCPPLRLNLAWGRNDRTRAAVVPHEAQQVLVLVDSDVSELVPRIVEERKTWKFLKILLAGT